MAATHDNVTSFHFPQSPAGAMPLQSLSPERVNANNQTPSNDNLSPAPVSSPTEKRFGHPELGPPGDFSKFSSTSKSSPRVPLEQINNDSSSGGSDSEHKPPISPVRLGQSMFGQAPGSGSKKVDIANWSPTKMLHSRTSSDVQGMVARFNSLDIRDHVEMRKKEAAALKRAQMGREEAEEDVKRLKEEGRAMKKDIDEAKERERRVAKRVDVLMEDLHRSKETQAHAQTLYEKEIKKARKEAFKASSTLVKLQEELKTARKALGVVQSDLDLERIKYTRKEQDAFAAQYQLVGVQQELEQAQTRIKTAEEERDALKTSLKEEEVARIAAEGRIPLPSGEGDEDDEFASPKKQRAPKPSIPVELALPRQDTEQLRLELDQQTRRTRAAEEQVDFMKMECQFGCCSCRMAEQQETSYIHDTSLEAQVQKFKDAIAAVLTPPASEIGKVDAKPVPSEATEAAKSITLESTLPEHRAQPKEVAFSPDSGTFHSVPFESNAPTPLDHWPREAEYAGETESSVVHHRPEPDIEFRSPAESSFHYKAAAETPSFAPTPAMEEYLPTGPLPSEQEAMPQPYSPSVSYAEDKEEDVEPHEDHGEQYYHEQDAYNPDDYNGTYRTVTTTTTVPLADSSSTPDYGAFFSPMTLTREEAIEQLRLRRGRARSAAGTPRKPLADSDSARRDVSAPEVKAKATPKAASKEKDRRR